MALFQGSTHRKFTDLFLPSFILTFTMLYACSGKVLLNGSGANSKPVLCSTSECIKESGLKIDTFRGINKVVVSKSADDLKSGNINAVVENVLPYGKGRLDNASRKMRNFGSNWLGSSSETQDSQKNTKEISSNDNSAEAKDIIKDENNDTFIRRLPQTLIIGVKKGGTKALLTFLSAHPDVRYYNKEVHFFDKYYDKGLKWYREKMPKSYPHEITVEKSPRYFITKQVPKRVYKMSPNIKLLVILRDPTARAISDYVHMKTRKKRFQIKGSLESLMFNNISKSGEPVNKTFAFIQNGMYSVHLKNWLKYFPRKRIHFVNGDKMITNPGKELIKVQKFLQLEPLVDEQSFVYNVTKRFYCVYKTLQDRKTKAQNAVCLGKSKGRKHPNVSDSTLKAMRDFYRPYNEELYRMTGINFGWK